MKTSFYSELSCTSQFKVLDTLLKMLLSTVSVVEATAIRVVLRSINISAVNMAHFLTSFCSERDQLEVRYKFERPAGICLFKVNSGNINVWNHKVNNKATRTKSFTSFWYLYC